MIRIIIDPDTKHWSKSLRKAGNTAGLGKCPSPSESIIMRRRIPKWWLRWAVAWRAVVRAVLLSLSGSPPTTGIRDG